MGDELTLHYADKCDKLTAEVETLNDEKVLLNRIIDTLESKLAKAVDGIKEIKKVWNDKDTSAREVDSAIEKALSVIGE